MSKKEILRFAFAWYGIIGCDHGDVSPYVLNIHVANNGMIVLCEKCLKTKNLLDD